jgi:hypothetical protein
METVVPVVIGSIIIIVMAYLIYTSLKLETKVDGYIIITEDETGKKMFTLEIDMNPDEIANMDYITFKVTDKPSEDLE